MFFLWEIKNEDKKKKRRLKIGVREKRVVGHETRSTRRVIDANYYQEHAEHLWKIIAVENSSVNNTGQQQIFVSWFVSFRNFGFSHLYLCAIENDNKRNYLVLSREILAIF